eukprot:gene1460-1693_t
MKYLLALALVVLVATSVVVDAKKKSNKKIAPKIAPPTSSTLNVHIVAHTHDDVGWLKTVDEYYYGGNMSIQTAGVQYTLDSVIVGLMQNPERRFIYVEIAFFERWWNEQTEQTQKDVTKLVHNGQLEFINGGWCMNDEAGTYYDDIIDQMTLGHQFLYKNFQVVPKIGWHIDPFGHSNTQATVFGSIGFDAFIIGRMDYQDITGRLADKQMEFMWRGSKSNPQYEVFTSVLRAMYCTPSGFNFEGGDDPIQDDPNLFNVNIAERAAAFVAVAQEYATHFRTNNVLIPFGCDFAYMNANMYFKNIDKLIAYINDHPELGLNVLYSTPSTYIEAVNAANLVWEVKTDDLFPYADGPDAYWTGYFTSRPALKGFVRQSNALLHVAEQLLVTSEAVIPSSQSLVDQVEVLREAQGVLQHHDAVAGTEQQHVANDYAERLNIGVTTAQAAINTVIGQLLTANSEATLAPQMTFCPLLNQSICPSTALLSSTVNVPVVLYNSLSWTRFEYVTLPVPVATVAVSDTNGAIRSQVILNQDGSQYSVTFLAEVPPLGYATYFLTNSKSEETEVTQKTEPKANEDIVFSNVNTEVRFDGNTGAIMSITNLTSGAFINVTQDYLFYLPSLGDENSSQASGAYIFRPIQQFPYTYNNESCKVTVAQGSTVSSLTRYWSPTMIQTFRLYADQDFLEIEETVGPIDISDGIGKEVISRWNTTLDTKNTWYSDSNGMEMMERILNYRPSWNFTVVEPTSGNYVPLNAIAYIQDTDKQLQLTFLTDRTRGCASLSNGELEMMLHRRTLMDDGRGVGEPMNESTVITTTTKVIFHDISVAAQSHYRPLAQQVAHPLYPVFTTTKYGSNIWNEMYQGFYSPLNLDLPTGIIIQSLQWLDDSDNAIILRLQNIYQVDEQDTQDPQTVTVDISSLFSFTNVTSVTEMNLSAVTKISNMNRLKWKTATEAPVRATAADQLDNESDFVVQITPMDIRTFIISVQTNGFESSSRN